MGGEGFLRPLTPNLNTTQNPDSWGRTNLGPQPVHKPLVFNVVVMGPFEEEVEGIGIGSDVVKVKGDDPATQGFLNSRGQDEVARWRYNPWVCAPWPAFEETPGP